MTELNITVDVSLDALDATIARLAGVEAIIAKYAALIEARARQLVPVKTGALRASITTHLEAMAAEIVAGENLTYASIIEYGTGNRAAKPYIRPAVEAYREAFIAEVQAALSGV